MSDYNYYASMANQLNNPNASIQEIEGWFKQSKPSSPNWKPQYIDVTKPMLKSNDQLLDEFGLDKSRYSVTGLQNSLDEQSYKAYNGLNDSLYKARHQANIQSAESFRSMSDTINAKYSQGIDLGINRAMDQANLLSTMLGTSQAGQKTIQEIDTQLGSSQAKLKESLIGNEQKAHETYNSLHEFLAKTAEQMYKEDIKRQEAEENYNKKVSEASNYLSVAQGVADTSYYAAILPLANSIYNNNQTKIASIAKAAKLAEASDKLSNAYIEAAKRNAEASIKSAEAVMRNQGYKTFSTLLKWNIDPSEVLRRANLTDKQLNMYLETYKEMTESLNRN